MCITSIISNINSDNIDNTEKNYDFTAVTVQLLKLYEYWNCRYNLKI